MLESLIYVHSHNVKAHVYSKLQSGGCSWTRPDWSVCSELMCAGRRSDSPVVCRFLSQNQSSRSSCFTTAPQTSARSSSLTSSLTSFKHLNTDSPAAVSSALCHIATVDPVQVSAGRWAEAACEDKRDKWIWTDSSETKTTRASAGSHTKRQLRARCTNRLVSDQSDQVQCWSDVKPWSVSC